MKKIFLLISFSLLGSLWGNSSVLWAGGNITGVISYQGQVPPIKKRAIALDQHACGREARSEELVVGKKGALQNVVVYLDGSFPGSPKFPEPPQGFVIDQKQCRFDPHVVIVGPGSPLKVLNSDGILHNFHTYSRTNLALNKAQPRSLPEMTLRFDRPEIFEVRCDVHDWMNAWVVVAPHPYYDVTDAQGRFDLKDVPAGDHFLRIWHESLGVQSKRIHVEEGQNVTFDLKLTKSH